MKENEIKDYIINYLNQLQDVIKRMADNSKSCKQYSISIFSAYLAFIAVLYKNDLPEKTMIYLFLSVSIGIIIIIAICMFLDGYYLRFERRFRNISNNYISSLKKNENIQELLYNFNINSDTAKSDNTLIIDILFSESVLLLYIAKLVFIIALILIFFEHYCLACIVTISIISIIIIIKLIIFFRKEKILIIFFKKDEMKLLKKYSKDEGCSCTQYIKKCTLKK